MKGVVAIGIGVAVAAALWYLVAPPRSPDSYREHAAKTLETLRSQVQTARLWEESVQRDDVFRSSATVGFEEAEADANKAASSFEGYEPPAGTEDVRSDVSDIAAETTSALAELRIAARRGDWAAVHERAAPLGPLADRLEALAQAVRP